MVDVGSSVSSEGSSVGVADASSDGSASSVGVADAASDGSDAAASSAASSPTSWPAT